MECRKQMKHMTRQWIQRSGVTLALLCAAAVQTLASLPTVVNQANTAFTDTRTGYRSVLHSNLVRVSIQPHEALVLEPNQTQHCPPGAPFAFSHILTNTGNTVSTYRFDWSDPRLQLVWDINRNGQYDPGEPVKPAPGQVRLQPGESVWLLLQGVAPVSASVGEQFVFQLSATAQAQAVSARVQDTVIISVKDAVHVVKSVDRESARPGDTLQYQVTATHRGMRALTPSSLMVDGRPRTLLLLKDAIPANTQLTAFETRGTGLKLYHVAGSSGSEYQSLPPNDPALVDAVALGLSEFIPDSSVQFTLNVRVSPWASGVIRNTAELHYVDADISENATVLSNRVDTALTGTVPPAIHFYMTDQFERIAHTSTLGKALFVQASAPECNLDSGSVERVVIRIQSQMTGDQELFTAVETGPNTGVFRILTPVYTRPADTSAEAADGALVQPGNGFIESRRRDTLVAQLTGCSGVSISADLMIDPYGVVFDSLNDRPIAGARVMLIDVSGEGNGGNPGGPAVVYEEDEQTPAPNSLVTGDDGAYVFPRVRPSTYRLVVIPPGDYRFPSTMPASQAPPGRSVDPASSYGADFVITAVSPTLHIDVPLDPGTPSGLVVQKTSLQREAEVGDTVGYVVTIQNKTGVGLGDVQLTDILPQGLAYLEGSVRRDNLPAGDPSRTPDGKLVFSLGSLAVNEQVVITYRARVGAQVTSGNVRNRAECRGMSLLGPVVSNTAVAVVRIGASMLMDTATIIGRVYVDRNNNGMRDADEPGVPGVRLCLDDGSFVITDINGKYSMYGVSARLHTIKLDTLTLPAGAAPVLTDNRQAGSADSRFVDVRRAELHRADFAIRAVPEAEAQIEARKDALRDTPEELRQGVSAPFTLPSEESRAVDTRSLPAAGVIRNGRPTPEASNAIITPKTTTATTDTTASPAAPTGVQLSDDQIASIDNPELGFITPRDGSVTAGQQVLVAVKGALGSSFVLTVNGVEVPQSRVGARSSVEARQLSVWQYVGVSLRPGINTLSVREIDAFGNARGADTITVKAPGTLNRIIIDVPSGNLTADGVTLVPVVVRLLDAEGLPVRLRTPVTLDASLGEWKYTDLDPNQPGLQLFIEHGEAEVPLIAPRTPESGTITAQSGLVRAEHAIRFSAELRPLLLTGSVEGMVSRSGRHSGRLRDLFELPLTSRGATDEGTSSGRISVFAKGQVATDTLLTLSYDSAKRADEPLFRDIQPDRFYPVYGDSSIRGFDAQSTSQLYARIDRRQSYWLWGDFTTATRSEVPSLGLYNRNLTGFRHHLEANAWILDVFASHASQQQITDEFRANGTSGPFTLRAAPIVENSERVEIIVRSRNQPSMIIRRTPLQRYADYSLDPLSGDLMLRHPLSSIDGEFNPVSIQVAYEVERDGPAHWITGFAGSVALHKTVRLGGSMVDDRDPVSGIMLRNASVTWRPSQSTGLFAEVVRSEHNTNGVGWGESVDLVHRAGSVDIHAWYGRTDRSFSNPSAMLSQGRAEAGIKGAWSLSAGTRLAAELLHTEDRLTGGIRNGLQLSYERSLSRNMKWEIGVRHAHETYTPSQSGQTTGTPVDFTSLRTRLSMQAPGVPALTLFGEYEADVADAGRQVLLAGGAYKLPRAGRVYAQHEFISSLGGRYALNRDQSMNTTVLGIDAGQPGRAQVFSEYRSKDAFNGRETEAAIGVRNSWELQPGMRIHAGLERQHTLSGGTGQDAFAVTSGLEYLKDPNTKATARLEYRRSGSRSHFTSTAGYARRLDDSWTLLGRNALGIFDAVAPGGSTTVEDRLQLGFAYRPAQGDTWNALGRYELRYRKDGSPILGAPTRWAHVMMLDVNYKPERRLTISGHYAMKWTRDRDVSSDWADSSVTQLLSGRVMRDVTDRVDVGVTGSLVLVDGTRSRRYGLGLEAGYLLERDTWLSVGYNLVGFRDVDMGDAGYTERGAYVRLRVKFDERILSQRTVVPVSPETVTLPANRDAGR